MNAQIRVSHIRKTILWVSLLSFVLVSSLVFNDYIVQGPTGNAGESYWSIFRGNLRRTGHSIATPRIDKLWWRITGRIHCSPAVVDDKVFIGLENGVHALNAKTGRKIWNYTVEVGLYALSVADGMVFIGATDHKVYALNETTGDQIWNYTTGWRVNSCPAAAEGIVFIGSEDGNVYALNETTGTIIWNYTTGRGVGSSPGTQPTDEASTVNTNTRSLCEIIHSRCFSLDTLSKHHYRVGVQVGLYVREF